jgi:hypothetical protein
MTFNKRSSSTVIMAITVIVGLAMGSGQALTSAYGLQQPYISQVTPFNPPTTAQPSAGSLTSSPCNFVTLPPASPTAGPGGTYIYEGSGPAPTTIDAATSFTGWCAQMNMTANGGNAGLDVNHPCWVQNGIGYYGDCDVAPVQGYSQNATGPTGGIPTEGWFHLAGVFLKPGAFLDLADTTPWYTTHGHMAMVLPCETDGTPDVRLYQGVIDGGVFTMEAPTMQYLQHISGPTTLGLCVYHFDTGLKSDADAPYIGDANGHPAQTESANPYGVTDFVLVNTSTHSVYFNQNYERYTSTFSVATGFMNVIG